MQVGLDKLGISCLRKDTSNQLVIRGLQQQARNPARQWLVKWVGPGWHPTWSSAKRSIAHPVGHLHHHPTTCHHCHAGDSVMDESAAHAPVHERLSTHCTESHQRSCSSGTHIAVAVKQEVQDISWWYHWDLQANSRMLLKSMPKHWRKWVHASYKIQTGQDNSRKKNLIRQPTCSPVMHFKTWHCRMEGSLPAQSAASCPSSCAWWWLDPWNSWYSCS